MSEEDDLLAAELALGLTDDPSAQARLTQDPALAQRMAWWQERMAGLAVSLAHEPPSNLWPKIEAALPQNDNSSSTNSVRRWKLVSAAMALVTVAALFMVAQRPQLALPPQPGPPAVASLSGDSGSALTIAYQADTRRLTVAPVKLDPGKGDAELWVIPVGSETAISLGVVDASKASTHQLDPQQAKLVAPGATFAISLEPTGGSPTGKATGPIVASGKLTPT